MPDRTLTLADGAVEPWTYPSGKLVPARAAEGRQRAGVDPTRRGTSCAADERELRLRGRREVPRHPRLLRGSRVVPLQAARARVPLALSQSVARARPASGARLKPAALAVRVAGLTIAEFSALTIEEAARCSPTSSSRRGRPRRPRDHQAAQRQAHVPAPRGARLPHAGPPDAHALGRRSAADQPRQPARLAARRHALRARRAVDRPARARHRRASPISAASSRRPATPWSSSSTTASFIEAADHVVELGPGSGERGGEIVFAGPRRSSAQTRARSPRAT